jgi:hypothetical protein
MNLSGKQLVLKPQDLVVAMKIHVNPDREFVFSVLAEELEMAGSAVHGSMGRAEQARLISRSGGSMRAMKAPLKDFLIYGARYAYPPQLGVIGRGIPTGVGAPVLASYFENSGTLVPVWPDSGGQGWGPVVTPLYPSAPAAAKKDAGLYDLLALFDALRMGAAREREIATQLIGDIFV